MSYLRHIEQDLINWKERSDRKPLVLRGARQVGKTTIVKQFAKHFQYKILLNLEKAKDVAFFNQYDEVKAIIEAMFIAKEIPDSAIEKTLIFIDEIQESPKAIKLLRYFYEELPQLHVITAGSLLEFVMHKVQSFPVGRVEYLYMHPLNFSEYLNAIGHNIAYEQLMKIPVKPTAHSTLLNLFHQFAIIGGMPEVVKNSIKHDSITRLPRIYESIWSTYKDDVEKYTSNKTERNVIKYIMNTAPLYLDQRIKFQNFGNSNYRSREVGEAMRSLDAAGIIRLIYPSTDVQMPIKPNIKKSPRLQFLDTGLVNHSLKIQAEMLGLKDLSYAFNGAIIPHLVTQELISINKFHNATPNFWVREKNQSQAEVDLLFAYKDKIIPIEIKSGKTGTLKSLHQFINRAKHKYAVRIYGGKFEIEKHKTPEGKQYTLMNLPYYLGTKLPEYIAYFVENN